jgi:DNA-binding transcriptional MocR family regulator
MATQFARRMDGLKASEIRELLKVTLHPETISFAGGLPAPELFPVRELAEVAQRVLADEGCEALRRIIARRMNTLSGTFADPEHVLITCGSQQGLDLSGKLFLDEGDAVLCESPTYLGAVQAFAAYRPRFVEVATDEDGMLPDALEQALAATDRVKLIYVVPDFQNPTGRTWSLERRLALADAARRHRVVIVEDHPYDDLRYEGDRLPPLMALDPAADIVFLGTFSKIFCPGLRIGWLTAPQHLFEKYVLVKQGVDLHTSTLSQRQLTLYLKLHDIEASIERMRELYRRRRDAMLAAMELEFPPEVTFNRPHGGLFLWAELPERLSARDLLAECGRHGVVFVPGGSFFPNGGHENTLRLNFSNMDEHRIAEGIRRMGAVLRSRLADSKPAAVAAAAREEAAFAVA